MGTETAVAYEAAVEAINGVVGAYSALIAREEQRPLSEQDRAALGEWTRQSRDCQHERRSLDPQDAAQVRMIRTRYAARLAELADVIG